MAHEQHVSVYQITEILNDIFFHAIKVYFVSKSMMQGTGAWHLFIISPVILVVSPSEIETCELFPLDLWREIMRKSVKLIVIGLLCLMSFVGLVSADVPSTAADITPVVWTNGVYNADAHTAPGGNPSCTQIGCGGESVKIEDASYLQINSNHTVNLDGGHWIKITIGATLQEISWVSDSAISCVIVKGGDSAYVYHYSQGATHDEGLVTPPNIAGNFGLSHMTFCDVIFTPEFPTMALPVGLLIGIFGAVLFTQRSKKE